MVIHHPRRLHEGIANGTSYELEAPFFQVLGHGIALRRGGGHLAEHRPMVDDGLPTNELPDVLVEAAELLPDPQIGFCIFDEPVDFQAVANNACIVHQGGSLCFIVIGHLHGVELVEGEAVGFSFVQYSEPTEAGLGTFEAEHLEELAIVVAGSSPFFIVVLDINIVALAPRAAGEVFHFRMICLGSKGKSGI
jgi:hypothetical protein